MNTELSPFHKEAYIGDYFLRGADIPAKFSEITAGRLVGLLLRSDSESEAAHFVPEQLQLGSQDITDFWSNYQRHVASLSPDAHEIQLQKAALFERYDTIFSQAIALRNPEVFEEYIGSDSAFSSVHRLQLDGTSYAVREAEDENTREIDKHLEAAVRVADIPHMEHIVAASYVHGVTVAPFVEGRPIDECDASVVTTAQVAELYAAMKQAEDRGVGFDFAGKNLLYEPNDGFTVIDLGMNDNIDHLSAVGAMMTLIDVLGYDETIPVENVPALARLVDTVAAIIRDDAPSSNALWFIEDAKRSLLSRVPETP